MLSLQLAHRLQDANILLIGAGEVALTRIPKLLPTGCKLTVIAPLIHSQIQQTFPEQIHDGININSNWNSTVQQTYRIIRDVYNKDQLDIEPVWSIILVCISDHDVSKQIYGDIQFKYGASQLINVADVPPLCNFYFGANATLANGHIQLLVSTNGLSPRFGALIRDDIEQRYETNAIELDQAISKLGELRETIRTIACNHDDVKLRMAWIKEITDRFGLQNCHRMNINKLTHLFADTYGYCKQEGVSTITKDDVPSREELLSQFVI